MTDFFDRHRFGRLLRAHLAEHCRDYFWFVVVASLIEIVYMGIALRGELQGGRLFAEFQFTGQAARYGVGLVITSFIFCGRYFRELQQPGSALTLLMRPASVFEKFLLTFLMAGLAFPVVFAVVYAVLNYPFVQLANALYVTPKVCPGCVMPVPPDFSLYLPFRMPFHIAASQQHPIHTVGAELLPYLLLWIMQGIVLGATVFFRRAGLLWMFLIGFVVMLGLSAFGIQPHLEVFIQAPNFDDGIGFSTVQKWLSLLVWGGILVLAWLALYFHIKEREVA